MAVVGEDGREFYGECSDFELSACSEFVRTAVLPQLGRFPGRSMWAALLAAELGAWLLAVPTKPKPVLRYDAGRDLGPFGRLLGRLLPHGWMHENVFAKLDTERRAQYVAVHGGNHHALRDARTNAFAFR